MTSKRGQITLFIIIGIVILFSVGLYLYITTSKAPFQLVQVEKAHPVKAFVQGCLDKVGEDGIRLIGTTGGFVQYPPEIAKNSRAYIPTGLDEVKIPLWYHDGQSKIPGIDFIKAQLNSYITQNLKDCLGNFDIYKQQYNIQPQGELKISSDLTTNGVIINANFPLKVEAKDMSESLQFDTYTATVPIRLQRAYDLAKEIFDKEQAQGFFESTVVDLIVLDPDIPDTDIDMSCAPKTWRVSDVKDKLKLLVTSDFPFIKLQGTNFVPYPQEWTYLKNHYLWDYSTKQFPDMSVAVQYGTDWPFTMTVRPNSGDVMRSLPMQGAEILSAVCTQIYHFTYDVKFPVMISIVDEESTTHKAYSFNYGMQVDVDHNLPSKRGSGVAFFEPELVATNDEYCDKPSQTLTLNLWNNVTGSSDVLDANLTLTCGRFVCDLGKSDWINGQTAGLQKKVPSCTNAIIQASKEGYETAKVFASTEVPKLVNLYMTPLKEISKISVKKHRSDSPAIGRDLASDEQLLITLKQANGTRESFVTTPSEVPQLLKFLANDDFTYDLTIYLVSGNDIVGGYAGTWTVPWQKLKDANEILFHVVEQSPRPSDETERAKFVEDLALYSKNVSAPEII